MQKKCLGGAKHGAAPSARRMPGKKYGSSTFSVELRKLRGVPWEIILISLNCFALLRENRPCDCLKPFLELLLLGASIIEHFPRCGRLKRIRALFPMNVHVQQ
jgi:hypothetical protein